ncbi:hypothetical protein AB0G67_47060 [Streptomyces sp. NPDC021056]|uniref:hypothetical protein n=1 Tax=unclassified Streptomyces TaxID=2593676 RepID=UPI003318F671
MKSKKAQQPCSAAASAATSPGQPGVGREGQAYAVGDLLARLGPVDQVLPLLSALAQLGTAQRAGHGSVPPCFGVPDLRGRQHHLHHSGKVVGHLSGGDAPISPRRRDLHRPLPAAPATGDVRSSGNARLLDGQLAVSSTNPRLTVALPHARVSRAGDIADGDLLLAAVGEEGADYFSTPYIAHPEPFDPSCGCGVCCLITQPGDVVVLSQGDPWETCGPWPADDLLLIVSAQRLPGLPFEE